MANQRVMTEPAGRELAAQLKALVAGAPAASFLAAYPPKSIFWTTDSSNPAARYGGSWKSLPTMGGLRMGQDRFRNEQRRLNRAVPFLSPSWIDLLDCRCCQPCNKIRWVLEKPAY